MSRWLLLVLVWLGVIAKPRFLVRYAESHPTLSQLSDDDFVIVRSGEFQKWACFKCPCGCGDKIALSLAANRKPSWRVALDWLKRPTVSPSIWQQDHCHAHFWIRGGTVDWCAGSGRSFK
jgi:Family of unknown function (DUF6527)